MARVPVKGFSTSDSIDTPRLFLRVHCAAANVGGGIMAVTVRRCSLFAPSLSAPIVRVTVYS